MSAGRTPSTENEWAVFYTDVTSLSTLIMRIPQAIHIPQVKKLVHCIFCYVRSVKTPKIVATRRVQ